MTFPSLKPRHNPNIQPEPSDPNFYCKTCDRKYKNITVYRQHLRYVYKINLPPLNVARQTRIRPNPNIQPNPSDPSFFCESCNYSYRKKAVYFQHLRRVHKMYILWCSKRRKGNPNVEPDPGDPKFYCKSCKKGYLNKKRFRDHLRAVHQLTLPPLKPKPNHDVQPDPNDPEFYCKSCSNNYLSKYKFQRHLSNVHKSIELRKKTEF